MWCFASQLASQQVITVNIVTMHANEGLIIEHSRERVLLPPVK